MSITVDEIDVTAIQNTLRRIGGETEAIEVKAATGGTPTNALREAMVAFSNREGGGTIILGMDEAKGFAIVGVRNPAKAMIDVSNYANSDISPAIRPAIEAIEIDGKTVVVITVPELPYEEKPAYITNRGAQAGAYVRVGPSNRQMTAYETSAFRDFHAQRTWDDRVVETTTERDLDQIRVNTFILEQQRQTGRSWSNAEVNDVMRMLRIVRDDQGTDRPTLAGLVCFGGYPQQYLYQARIQFTVYAGTDSTTRNANGARYIDAREFDGPASDMVDAAVATIVNSMPVALYVDDIQHTRSEEIPRDAIREALINAVVHRDYGPYMIGSVIQVFLYSDRLEIRSPGGLHGGARITNLTENQSTRNPLLMRFMLEMHLVENRGSGVREMTSLCRAAGLPEPMFTSNGNAFTVTFWRRQHGEEKIGRSMREPEPVFDTRIRTIDERVIELARQIGELTNEIVRTELQLERWQAARLLKRLVDRGVLVQRGEKRGVYYTLA